MIDPNQLFWDSMEETEIRSFMQSPLTDEPNLIEAQRQLALRGIIVEDKELCEIKEKRENAAHITAKLCTNSICLAAMSITELINSPQSEAFIGEELLKAVLNMQKEGQATEQILAANAFTLNVIFNQMVRAGMKTGITLDSIDLMERYMSIGLRAQNQLRKTILALDQIKNPKLNMHVNQQNIAGIQQVNNIHPASDNILNPKNELLKE
jgi:hypothetical protein